MRLSVIVTLRCALLMQVTAWLQDTAMLEHMLMTIAQHLVDVHWGGYGGLPTSEAQKRGMVASALRMQSDHLQRVCKHLLSLLPLQQLFRVLPMPLHHHILAAAMRQQNQGNQGNAHNVFSTANQTPYIYGSETVHRDEGYTPNRPVQGHFDAACCTASARVTN